jgi:hypothetical protein
MTIPTTFQPSKSSPKKSFKVDPDVSELIRRAAAARRMDPNAFLAILIDCDVRGIRPLWRK